MFNLPRNLPNVIRFAMDRAHALPGISRNAKITFGAVISFIDRKDSTCTVFARQTKIAERAGCTSRTVRTHLRELEAAGLLVSLEQAHARRTGFFLVTHKQLTEAGKAAVGLFQGTTEESEPSHLQELSVPSLSSSNKQAPTAAPAGIVPQDLAFLSERMDSWGIFNLMKKAKEQNRLLSDVAQAAKSRIESLDLRGGQAFKYLAALIASGACFVYTGQQARAAEVQVKTATVQETTVASVGWNGKSFFALKAGVPVQRFDFERTGAFVLISDLVNGQPPRMMPLHRTEDAFPLAKLVNDGKLIEASRLEQSI